MIPLDLVPIPLDTRLLARTLLLASLHAHEEQERQDRRRQHRAAAGGLAAIYRAADLHLRAVALAFRTSWLAAGAALDHAELAKMLRQNNRDGAVRILFAALDAGEPALRKRVQTRLQQCAVDAGKASLRSTKARGSWFQGRPSSRKAVAAPRAAAARIDMRFNEIHPRVLSWAEQYAARLVTEISDGTKKGLRDYIAGAIGSGTTVENMARDLRFQIGLRSDQVAAVERYRQGGATEDQVERYAARLLRQRAMLIARTETAFAAGEGQAELWRQAVEEGQLPADSKRVWIINDQEGLCDFCEALDGEIAALDEPFIHPETGEPVENIPAHPACKCNIGIARPEDIERAKTAPEAAPAPAIPELPTAEEPAFEEEEIVRVVEPPAPLPEPPAEPPVEAEAIKIPRTPQATIAERAMATGEIITEERVGVGSLNPVYRTRFRDPATGAEVTGYWKRTDIPEGGMHKSFTEGRFAGTDGTQGLREVIASELDDVLGTNLVPAVTWRKRGDVMGSVMAEAPGEEWSQSDSATRALVSHSRMVDLSLFDYLIGNTDRHGGNAFVDSYGNITAVDNGLTMLSKRVTAGSFRPDVEANFWYGPNPTLTMAERNLWLARLRDPSLTAFIRSLPIGEDAVNAALQRVDDLTSAILNDTVRDAILHGPR